MGTTSWRNSLILKMGVFIVLVESLILLGMGMFYMNRFSEELDRGVESRIQTPGRLMDRQLLRYESVADRQMMTDLVGDEFVDGMVISADGRVYYAFNADDVGSRAERIPGLHSEWVGEAGGAPLVRKIEEGGRDYMVSVTPLTAYEEAEPFFYVYVKSSLAETQEKKRELISLFTLGGIFCVLVTSFMIIALAKRLVIGPLAELERSSEHLAKGELSLLIDTSRKDELGGLARSFAGMRDAIIQKMDELRNANQILEAKEKRLQAVLSSLPDLVLIMDGEGRFHEVLTERESVLHAPAGSLLGRWIQDLFPAKDARIFLDVVQVTMASGKPGSRVCAMDVDGEGHWFELRTAFLDSSENASADSGAGVVLAVIRDVTEEKKAEDALREAKEDAEEANLRLVELDAMKSTFLSSVSHELRTPLTSLLGFAKLISKSFSNHFLPLAGSDALRVQGRRIVDNLGIIEVEGERLTRLINEVLDLNKIESGKMTWKDEDVMPGIIAERALRVVRSRFENTPQVDLLNEIAPNLPPVCVDVDRIIQVLINLLDNAAKFTREGSVSLSLARDGDYVRFTVSDTGRGVPVGELENIFGAFHQVASEDNLRDALRGTGLGLTICREIVERHGGRIWAENLASGSAFIFTLPVAAGRGQAHFS